MEKTKRLFVALPISDEMRDALIRYCDSLPKQNLRFTTPQEWHITVVFVGDRKPEEIENLKVAIREAVTTIEPFELQVKGVTTTPRLLWVEFKKHALFEKLVQNVGALLHIPLNHDSIAHLTLARFTRRPRELPTLPPLTLSPLHVDRCHLYTSDLSNTRPIHTIIETFRLCTSTNS